MATKPVNEMTKDEKAAAFDKWQADKASKKAKGAGRRNALKLLIAENTDRFAELLTQEKAKVK